MRKQPTRAISGLAVLSLNLGVSFAQTQTLTRLKGADLAAALALVEQSSLPAGAGKPAADETQVMKLGGSSPLTLVPVRYAFPADSPAPFFQCGLFLQGHTGGSFVTTFGSGNTETESCSALEAMGTAPAASGGVPRLILIYRAYAARAAYPATILLVWDARAKTYTVDDALSQWLGEQKDGSTVAGARRLLAKKKASAPGAGA